MDRSTRLRFPVLLSLLLAVACNDDPFRGVEGGVYSLDVLFDGQPFGVSGGVLRLGSRQRTDGTLNGGPLRELVFSDQEIRAENTLTFSTGASIAYTIRITRRVDPKTFSGRYRQCLNPGTGTLTCTEGDLTAVRIERRPGESGAQGLEVIGETDLTLPAAAAGGAASGLAALHDGDHSEEGEVQGKAAEGDGEPAVNVRVAGDLAYVARYGDGLIVVDVSDRTRPRPIGRMPVERTGEIYNDIKITPDGQHVLAASSSFGLVSIDVSDPTRPSIVSRFPQSTTRVNVHTLFLEGSLAYLADITFGGIRIVDVSDPAQPVEVGNYRVGGRNGFVHDLMIRNGIAYLSAWQNGLIVVDCTNPAQPVELGRYLYDRPTSHSPWVGTIGDRLIAIHGDEGFSAHLRVLDVTEPANMRLLSEWQTRPEVSIHNVMLLGTRAYIAHYQDGLRILDLANPAQPREVAYYNSWAYERASGTSLYEGVVGIDVDPVERIIYAADSERGLIILRETGTF